MYKNARSWYNGYMTRYALEIDTESLPVASFARFALDVANVTFTNVDCPPALNDPNRTRCSVADCVVTFDATPADVLAYCDAVDLDPDAIIPIELA